MASPPLEAPPPWPPSLRSQSADVDTALRQLLAETLGLSETRVAAFDGSTELFGALPEFDSMAVANLLTGIEERFGVLIEDSDVEAEDFATLRIAQGLRRAAGPALAARAIERVDDLRAAATGDRRLLSTVNPSRNDEV